MSRKDIYVLAAMGVLAVLLVSCKKTYFHVSEEVNKNAKVRFTQQNAYYQMGKSIALNAGRYQLVPGDSIVLYIEGLGKFTGVGEVSVATLDIGETSRFYIALPNMLAAGKTYDTRNRAICEITGNFQYGSGENLFICQSGQVVIDSLKGSRVHGAFSGEYLNARNQSLSVTGAFKAGAK